MKTEQTEIRVVLVDRNGVPTGETMEKMEAHQCGALHMAFSVIMMTPDGYVLIQQRSLGVYHSGGLWGPSGCSHPRESETIIDAVKRRVAEELGVWWTREDKLEEVCTVRYCVDVEGLDGKALIEHEFDYIVIARVPSLIKLQIVEKQVQALRWVKVEELLCEMEENPSAFVPWFRPILDELVKHLPEGGD